jgi:hypothetical protein
MMGLRPPVMVLIRIRNFVIHPSNIEDCLNAHVITTVLHVLLTTLVAYL